MVQPEISVVLPVYNGAKYIESAIRSLLSQLGDGEIIVSDDCSSDNTLAIIRSLQSSKIQVITNSSNGGQFVNFNRGIKAASGTYIQLFSHDDIAHPGFLQSQVEVLRRNKEVGLVYASCKIINEAGETTSICDDEGTPAIIDFPTYLQISSRHAALPPSISTVMFPKSILSEVGAFDDKFAVDGDLEFYNRVAEKFYFARNRKLLIDVRVHRGSVTSNSLSPLCYMREEVEILKFYRRHLGEERYKQMIRWRSRHRGADHAKYLIRAVVKGDFGKFAQGYRALSQVHNVPLCIAFALFAKLNTAQK